MKHFLMRSNLALLLLFTLNTATAIAQVESSTQTNTSAPSTRALRVYFAGGSGFTKPSGEFNDAINSYVSVDGRVNASGVLELPGVFVKKTPHLWLGLLPSLVAEEYSSNYSQETTIALTHFNLDASAFWFLNADRAEGVLFRLDAGYTYLHRFERIALVDFDRYYNGMNMKASVGYALRGFSEAGFWSFNLGLFAVSAGAIQETGGDFTVGIML